MIRLVKTDRRINFQGVTPAFVVGATLFFVAVLAAHFVGQRHEPKFTPCVFKLVTSKPCFLCGGTRASVNLAQGKIVAALRFNPLVTLVLSYVALALILKLAAGRKLQLSKAIADKKIQWTIVILLVIANWIYVIRALGA